MTFSERFIRVFRSVLPAPFTIAALLTVVTFVLALLLAPGQSDSGDTSVLGILSHWEKGLWNAKLLVFALQMMLMLVLGHVLALTRPVNALINVAVKFCNNTANAAALVTLLTVLVSLFNWGLGLIFGAIFARKVAENALKQGWKLNYPIIGAAGYSGLMVWHGGISGSSLIKIAEPSHIKSMMADQLDATQIAALPEVISFSDTVFSPMNLTISLVLILILPLAMWWLGKRTAPQPIQIQIAPPATSKKQDLFGAERLDHSLILCMSFGGLILLYVLYKAFSGGAEGLLSFFTPNNINLLLLGLGLTMHGNFNRFLQAIDEAISGAAGILVQFPLYFGIMGVMVGSGLVAHFSQLIAANSNAVTYPIFTFFSAGLVNIFVPSGGGQWAVQGPIIVQAAQALDVPLAKSVLAMAYGDQITNMLQPFWALPLLGITGLKAKEILPYTLFLLLVGSAIFLAGLLIF